MKTRMKCVGHRAVLAILLSGIAPNSFVAAATFQGLGDLPGGSAKSEAYNVSANGLVVVGHSYSGSGWEAFRWAQSTGMVPLGDLPGGSFCSEAWAVSSDGSVVVGYSVSALGAEAYRWTEATGMVPLGDLPGGSFYSQAWGVSADGSVVVGASTSASGLEAYRWTEATGMVPLGDLPGGSFESQAWDVSSDGCVIAGWSKSEYGDEAFKWTFATGMYGLGDLPGGGVRSRAWAVSGDGSVVVGASKSELGDYDGDVAFRWTQESGMSVLGDLPGGGFWSAASGVSADGSVVVGYSKSTVGDDGFIWDENNGMRNLKEMLEDDYGLDLTGWTLRVPTGISDDGSTIVGVGINPDGHTEAWIATVPIDIGRADWIEEDKLVGSDSTYGDRFGWNVSICGDYAIVGAFADDSECGSAYVFHREDETWIEQAKLTASDRAAGDRFGWATAITSDYAIVGAYQDDSWTGAAYMFKRNGTTWTQHSKLTSSDGWPGQYFGLAVSMSGNYAIVSAIKDQDNGLMAGAAYIFKLDSGSNTWTQKAKITATDGAAIDYFGESVFINGDYAIVGAIYDDDNGTDSGSAYIFKRDAGMDSWIQQAKLIASDGTQGDALGNCVSMNANYAFVASNSDDEYGINSGSVYVFKRNADLDIWTEWDKIVAWDVPSPYDSFGSAVSVSGDYLIVGARADDDKGIDSGSAYIFKCEGTSWTAWQKLTAPDGASQEHFGRWVSIHGEHLVVGAANYGVATLGSAYVFSAELEQLAAYYPSGIEFLTDPPPDFPAAEQVVIEPFSSQEEGFQQLYDDYGMVFPDPDIWMEHYVNPALGYDQYVIYRYPTACPPLTICFEIPVSVFGVLLNDFGDCAPEANAGFDITFVDDTVESHVFPDPDPCNIETGLPHLYRFFGVSSCKPIKQIVMANVSPVADGFWLWDSWISFAPINSPPVADAGSNVTVEAENPDGAEVSLDASGSTDPDSPEGTNDDIVSFDWYEGDTHLGSGELINCTFAPGTHTVTLIITDSCGETDESEVIIVVQDTTPPAVTCPDNITVEQASHAGTTVSLTGSASDNCDPQLDYEWSEGEEVLGSESTLTHTFNLGTYTLTLTATDDSGNVGTDTVTVTVVDTTPPAFTFAPPDMEVECDGAGNVAELDAWLASAAATDISGNVTITHDFVALSDDCGGTGSATVTWTAADGSGNAATASATFAIVDTTVPTFTTVPVDTVVQRDGNGNMTELNQWLASPVEATDICGSVNITNDYSGFPYGCGNTGSLTVTWTAEDECGKTSTTSATFTIEDPTAAVTYDGDVLLSTGGNPTIESSLVAKLRDADGFTVDIDGEEVTFTLTADGVGTIVVSTSSLDGIATAVLALEPAIYMVEVTLGCSELTASAILVVYNPEGGFATGGGWIIPEDDGLNTHPNERANFGFNAKYKKGDPTGHLEFRYSDGYIDLKSLSIEQLVITGGKIAQFKGWALVNGEPGYWFFVKAIDNGEPGTQDTFEIKIWAPGVDIEGDPTERAGGVLQGGNIVVHTK